HCAGACPDGRAGGILLRRRRRLRRYAQCQAHGVAPRGNGLRVRTPSWPLDHPRGHSVVVRPGGPAKRVGRCPRPHLRSSVDLLIREIDIRIPPEELGQEELFRVKLSRTSGISPDRLRAYEIV